MSALASAAEHFRCSSGARLIFHHGRTEYILVHTRRRGEERRGDSDIPIMHNSTFSAFSDPEIWLCRSRRSLPIRGARGKKSSARPNIRGRDFLRSIFGFAPFLLLAARGLLHQIFNNYWINSKSVRISRLLYWPFGRQMGNGGEEEMGREVTFTDKIYYTLCCARQVT